MKITAQVICIFVCFAATPPLLAQPKSDAPGYVSPQEMSEKALVERITRLGKMIEIRSAVSARPELRQLLLEETVTYVDTFLARFPKSTHIPDATIAKLKALAELARADEAQLAKLLTLTERIGKDATDPHLRSESAYYGIQAFVLAARREGMGVACRLSGTAERYEAFLEDYPDSPHAAVIRASLIRNLLARDQLDGARAEFKTLERLHPNDRATRRARGELYHVDAVGKPFVFDYTTSDKRTIRSRDYLGNVLIVHFWASWSASSQKALPKLAELHRKHKDRGLRLVGVNVDKNPNEIGKTMDKLGVSWPQYFDEKGLENDALVAMGVQSVPTYFVVDRQGILRDITPSEDLGALVSTLLAEPAQKP